MSQSLRRTELNMHKLKQMELLNPFSTHNQYLIINGKEHLNNKSNLLFVKLRFHLKSTQVRLKKRRRLQINPLQILYLLLLKQVRIKLDSLAWQMEVKVNKQKNRILHRLNAIVVSDSGKTHMVKSLRDWMKTHLIFYVKNLMLPYTVEVQCQLLSASSTVNPSKQRQQLSQEL